MHQIGLLLQGIVRRLTRGLGTVVAMASFTHAKQTARTGLPGSGLRVLGYYSNQNSMELITLASYRQRTLSFLFGSACNVCSCITLFAGVSVVHILTALELDRFHV